MPRRQYKTAFAATGDKTSIPDAVQPDGSVSLQEGYGFDYQRDPQTDPLAKVFPRDAHNGTLNEITASLGEIQQQGYAIWTVAGAPYMINAVVRHNDANWKSNISNNNDEPGVGAGAASWRNDDQGLPANLITSGVAGSFSAPVASANGTSAAVSISAAALCLKNPANEQVVLSGVSVSPSISGSGANGLDTGVSAAPTWYYLWVIWNGTTTAGLISLSPVTPSMPAGYTYRARVGAIRTDGSANKFPLRFSQNGRSVDYAPLAATNLTATPVLASGTTSGASSAVSTVNFIPVTAKRLRASIYALAPAQNGNYVALSTRQVTEILLAEIWCGGVSGIYATAWGEIDSSNGLYWVSGANINGVIKCIGWEDNL